MTKKLNQTLAIEKSLKGRVENVFAQLSASVQKPDLMDGFSKTFKPINEDAIGPQPQSKKVQLTSKEVFNQLTKSLGELFTTTAAKDIANCTAKADVTVNGEVLLRQVPATYLLFLDKQLTALATFAQRFSELPSDTNWIADPNTGYYRSEEIKTQGTQLVKDVLVKAPATDKHPAQVEVIDKQVPVGVWTTTKFSGAISRPDKLALLERIQNLQIAVKEALEDANGVAVGDHDHGSRVMKFLFGPLV